MKMNPRNKLISALVFAGLITTSGAAHADGSAAVVAAVRAAQAAITAVISSGNAALQALMVNSNTRLDAIRAGQEKQSQVNKQIAQTEADYRSQVEFQRDANEIEMKTADMGNSACLAINLGSKLNNAQEDKQAMVKAMNMLAVKRNMHSESTSKEVADRFNRHGSKFCSTEDQARGRCTVTNASMQNADVVAQTLFSPNDGMTLSDEELVAAKEYAQGVVNPFPTTPLPKQWEKTPQGKAYVVAQMVEQQRLSLADSVFQDIIAARMPNTEIGSSLKLAGVNVNNPSIMAVMKTYSDNFTKPSWVTQVSTSPDQTWLLKENVRQAAFKNWMDYNSYLQMEKLSALLAATLAMEARTQSAAILQQQRQAAAQAAGRYK